jgi:hypothetical protein
VITHAVRANDLHHPLGRNLCHIDAVTDLPPVVAEQVRKQRISPRAVAGIQLIRYSGRLEMRCRARWRVGTVIPQM